MPRLTAYQLLTAAAAVATLVLIAIGALVRTSGSGLGCPDWPTCHGAWIPPLEREAIIEYSHRSAAAIVSILLVATLFETLRSHRGDRALVGIAMLAVPLIAFQAWLGKVTVEHLEDDLSPAVLTLHLATALLLLAVICTTAALAYLGPGRQRIEGSDRAGILRVVMVCAVVTYLVLISGAYVVKADATTACISWPGCAAAPIPFVDGGFVQDVHWLHRISVLIGALAIGAVAVTVQSAAGVGPMLLWLLTLYGVQVLVGAGNIWTNFSGAIRITHLAVGAAIWALLVLMAVAGRYRRASETRSALRERVTAI